MDIYSQTLQTKLNDVKIPNAGEIDATPQISIPEPVQQESTPIVQNTHKASPEEVYFNRAMGIDANDINISDTEKRWAAVKLQNQLFPNIGTVDGRLFSKDRHTVLSPTDHLRLMQDVFKRGSFDSLFSNEFKEYKELSSFNEKAEYAIAHLPGGMPDNALVRGYANMGWNEFTKEEYELLKGTGAYIDNHERDFLHNYFQSDDAEKAREIQERIDEGFAERWLDSKGADMWKAAPEYQNYIKAKKIREQYEDDIYRAKAIKEYEKRLADQHSWMTLTNVRENVSGDTRDVLDMFVSAQDNAYARSKALDKFRALPLTEQRKIAGTIQMLHYGKDTTLLGDAFRAMGRTAASVIEGVVAQTANQFLTDEEQQEIAEQRAILTQVNQGRMKEWGWFADGVIGAFATIPYMAAAAIPYAGIPIMAATAADEMEQQVAAAGGDVTDPEFRAAKFFGGISVALVERIQVGQLSKIGNLSKRQLYCDMFHSINNFVKVQGLNVLTASNEALEEAIQGGITEFAVAHGLDQNDPDVAFLRGFVRDGVESLSTMLILSQVGGATKAYQYRNGPLVDAEDAAIFALRTRELNQKLEGNPNDTTSVAEYGRQYGEIAGNWINAGENTTARVRALQRMGASLEQAVEIDGALSSIWKSLSADTSAREELVGGRHIKTESELISELGKGGVLNVETREDGSTGVTVDILGSKLNIDFATQENTEIDPETQDENLIASIVKATGVTSVQAWKELAPEQRKEILDQYKIRMRGSWKITTPDGNEVDGAITDSIVNGTIFSTKDSLPQTAWHEYIHGVSDVIGKLAFAEDGSVRNQELASLVTAIGKKYAPLVNNERFNEEMFADAFRDYLTQNIKAVEDKQSVFGQFVNFLKKLVGMKDSTRDLTFKGKTAADALFNVALTGKLPDDFSAESILEQERREALDRYDVVMSEGEEIRFSIEAQNAQAEYDSVVAKYKDTDQWMKAPNGKPTNLTERQWIQVRTPSFTRWFGDWENDPANASKIVDENGEPLVVYHQTNSTVYINRETGENWDEVDWQERAAWDERDDWEEYWEEQDFYTFSRINARTTNELDGFFFAPEYDEYHEYGKRTIPVFLNVRKPASKEDYTIDATRDNAGQKERIRMQNEGYDGVVYVNDDGRVAEYIAFEPNQIKSATDNIGTFDPSNPDVRYSVVTIDNKNIAIANNYDGETDAKSIREYLKNDIGLMATIIETGVEVYIGKDLPNEYVFSKYAKKIKTKSQEIWNAKVQASTVIQEMIRVATNRRWEKQKHKHTRNANRFKYGFYRYDSIVAIPSGSNYVAYNVELVIRNDSKGKHFLYDVVNVKENREISEAYSAKIKQIADRRSLYTQGIKPNFGTDVNTPSEMTRYSIATNSNITDDGRKLYYKSGFLKYSVEDDELIIENVEVPLEDRNKGIATELVKAIRRKGQELNLPVTGYIYPQDEHTDINRLREFYDRLGFNIDSYDMMSTDDIRYSITAVDDATYLTAVQAGDMETAQRMVDEAAENAGYVFRGYHGTPTGEFTVFYTDRVVLTDNEKTASTYKNTDAIVHGVKPSGKAEIKNLYADTVTGGKIEIDMRGRVAARIDPHLFKGLRTWMNKHGLKHRHWADTNIVVDWFVDRYGSQLKTVVFKNIVDPVYQKFVDEWDEEYTGTVVFELSKNRVKSADPVTYDDNGNVIPLSQRFNPKKDDIRYSITIGDGITQANAKDKLNGLPKTIINNHTQIIAALSSNSKGKLLSKAAVSKTIKNGFTAQQHNDLAANIDILFKEAYLAETSPDKNGDINIKSIKRFVAPVQIKGQEAAAWITIKESVEHGHRIYSVEGMQITALPPTVRRALKNHNSAGNAVIDIKPNSVDNVNTQEAEPLFSQPDATRFSVATWKDGGRAELEKFLKNNLPAKDRKEIMERLDTIAEVAETFANELDADGNIVYENYSKWSKATVEFDDDGKPVFGIVRPNGEYIFNIDFSTVCKKRRPLDYMFNQLYEKGIITDENIDRILSSENVVVLQELLKENNLEVACALCFVDSKRYKIGEVAKSFSALWNSIIDIRKNDPEAYKEALKAARNRKAGKELKEDGKKKNPTFYDRCVLLIEKTKALHEYHVDAGNLISADKYDEFAKNELTKPIFNLYRSFGGVSKAKDSHSDVPYNNDIIRPFSHSTNPSKPAFNKKKLIEKTFGVGGVRIQSFSDFVGSMWFDYVQMVAELAARGLPAHAYTKEINCIKLLAKTGIKLNMSLVPAGTGVKWMTAEEGAKKDLIAIWDKNSQPVIKDGLTAFYDFSDECFPPKEAFAMRDEAGNVGAIIVGVSDEHIELCLADPRIDMVIPYHKSGISPEVAKRRGIDEYNDYTNEQNTRYADTGKKIGSKDEEGNKRPASYFQFYDVLKEIVDGGNTTSAHREVARKYLEHSDKHKYLPKFDKYRDNENYYKLLADFRMEDSNGVYSPQTAVRCSFDMANIEAIAKECIEQYEHDMESLPVGTSLNSFINEFLTRIGEKPIKARHSVVSLKEQIESSVMGDAMGDMIPRTSVVATNYSPYSQRSNIVAIMVQDKINGIDRPNEHYESLALAFGIDEPVEELIRSRNKVLDKMRDDTGHYAKWTSLQMAASAEESNFKTIVENLFSGLVGSGSKMSAKAERAWKKAQARMIRAAKGRDLQDLVWTTTITC